MKDYFSHHEVSQLIRDAVIYVIVYAKVSSQ